MTVIRPESRMERLNKETWLLMEPEETQLVINCDEENQRTLIQGGYILSLPERCEANTDSMTLVAPKYEAEVIVDGTIVQSVQAPINGLKKEKNLISKRRRWNYYNEWAKRLS